MAGRPIALTDDKRKRLLKAISDGNTQEVAARFAGVGVSTLCNYLKDARENPDSQFRELLDDIKEAENEAVMRNVGCIRKASARVWTAAAWWLERRHPDDWAKKDKHELTGPKGGPLVLNIVEEVVESPGEASPRPE